jgi:hypothetical protein
VIVYGVGRLDSSSRITRPTLLLAPPLPLFSCASSPRTQDSPAFYVRTLAVMEDAVNNVSKAEKKEYSKAKATAYNRVAVAVKKNNEKFEKAIAAYREKGDGGGGLGFEGGGGGGKSAGRGSSSSSTSSYSSTAPPPPPPARPTRAMTRRAEAPPPLEVSLPSEVARQQQRRRRRRRPLHRVLPPPLLRA